eukprot:TRINITY_DN12973_c0_g9_i1.p1 TRINITY_DN12973_c0_g9~~TRINITY_DN12973_c0_g9_i1.p1  ORF type:complete len:285 (+),score=76.85 TRINITY_DN12973_c0_g9_i1:594-1448(+)
MVHEVQSENNELAGKASRLANEAAEVRSNLSILQKEYSMVKSELQDALERGRSYKSMRESLDVECNRENMESQIAELTRQLDSYEAAYKSLEDKFKLFLQETGDSKNNRTLEPTLSKSAGKTPPSKTEIANASNKKRTAEATKKKTEEQPKSHEQAETLIADLRKKISEDADAKQTLQEIIKIREDIIKKQKENIESANARLEADKEEIQTSKTLLSQRNAEVKSLTARINEVAKELSKYKKPAEKKNNPRSLVRQRLKKEKTEVQPFLFGPVMDENDIDALNN